MRQPAPHSTRPTCATSSKTESCTFQPWWSRWRGASRRAARQGVAEPEQHVASDALWHLARHPRGPPTPAPPRGRRAQGARLRRRPLWRALGAGRRRARGPPPAHRGGGRLSATGAERRRGPGEAGDALCGDNASALAAHADERVAGPATGARIRRRRLMRLNLRPPVLGARRGGAVPTPAPGGSVPGTGRRRLAQRRALRRAERRALRAFGVEVDGARRTPGGRQARCERAPAAGAGATGCGGPAGAGAGAGARSGAARATARRLLRRREMFRRSMPCVSWLRAPSNLMSQRAPHQPAGTSPPPPDPPPRRSPPRVSRQPSSKDRPAAVHRPRARRSTARCPRARACGHRRGRGAAAAEGLPPAARRQAGDQLQEQRVVRPRRSADPHLARPSATWPRARRGSGSDHLGRRRSSRIKGSSSVSPTRLPSYGEPKASTAPPRT